MKHKERNQKEKPNLRNSQQDKHLFFSIILLVCIILFVTLVRIRLLSTPLERDEGEYAYMGQLLLQGVPPFQEAFNMKLPGTSAMYALFMFLFGETITAVHLGLLIVNATSIVLLFILTRRWLGSGAGVIAALSFSLMTLSPALFGFAAHATHFVILFTLGGVLMLDKALEHKKLNWLFIAGILLGCAFLMKQPGIFFFLFGISLLVYHWIIRTIPRKDLLRFSIFLIGGFSVPLVIVLAVIMHGGTFDRFWFWIVQYGPAYGFMTTMDKGIENFKMMIQMIWDYLPLLCLLCVVGFVLLVKGKFPKHTKGMLFLFGFFSLLALLPGLYFRNHYFILIAPACSMFIGSAFQLLQKSIQDRSTWKSLLVLVPVIVLGENILSNKQYYFTIAPTEIVKRVYNGIFPESIVIGEYLASHTSPNDRIAVLGSEPQIYFYARRRSASGHIYMFGLMEDQPYARKMQEELISDIEHKKPQYIILYNIASSWNATLKSELLIVGWREEYIPKHYRKVGIVDLVQRNDTRYIFGNDVQQYVPHSNNLIYIYERIADDR